MTEPALEPEALLRQILADRPMLNSFGYGANAEPTKTKAEILAEIERMRACMFEPEYVAQFVMARSWLRRFPKQTRFNRIGTSYGLKHLAAIDIGYTTNGVFIAAAIAEGFTVRRIRNTPNVLLNISKQAWWR